MKCLKKDTFSREIQKDDTYPTCQTMTLPELHIAYICHCDTCLSNAQNMLHIYFKLINIFSILHREILNINKEFKDIKMKASKKAKERKEAAKQRMRAAVNVVKVANRIRPTSPETSDDGAERI